MYCIINSFKLLVKHVNSLFFFFLKKRVFCWNSSSPLLLVFLSLQEHHLQRAISAQQVYGEKRDNMVIPVPEAESNITYYDSLYAGDFKMPKQLIHLQRKCSDFFSSTPYVIQKKNDGFDAPYQPFSFYCHCLFSAFNYFECVKISM